MAGKERGPFRPLGLRMQDFGRRLMRHYVSPQTTPPPQNFAPAPGWQTDTQTPLMWDESQPDNQPFENPPVEMDTLPAAEAPQAPPRPVRRAAPSSIPTVRRKADSEDKIDPRLLAILAAHQERETRVAEIRERKTAQANDIQRQAETGEGESLPRPRRSRASFDYVETKALLPPEDEMGRTAPPKTPPGNVIQPARESNQPDEDDSEESSQAGSVDIDTSQPVDQASPADAYIPAAPPALIQRTAEVASQPDDVSPEELPYLPDDEPETEPVYPQVYGLPQFPRVAEEPELFGEREITPPPAEPVNDPGKPDTPISPSTSPASSLQREANITPFQYAADVPDAEPEFFAPAADVSEPDAPSLNVQRRGETPPTQVQREIEPQPTTRVQRETESPSPTRARRRKESPTEPPASSQPQVNQPAHEQPPIIQRQNVPPEITEPTAEPAAWENNEADVFSSEPETYDQTMDAQSTAESVDIFSAAQPSVQREIEPADENYWVESEAEIEAPEEFVPSVFDQGQSPQTPSAPERPVVQRKTETPLSASPVQSDRGQGVQSSDMYFDDASYDQFADTEPIQSTFVQRDYEDVPPTIEEAYWTEVEPEAEAAPDEFAAQAPTYPPNYTPPASAEAPAASERPVVQRKRQKPRSASPVQSDRGQGDESAEPSFESAPYSENVDTPSVESGFVQRDYEDAPPTIEEAYWTESESEAEATPDEFAAQAPAYPIDYTPPVSAEAPSASERPVIQRKTQSPPSISPSRQEQGDESADFNFENPPSDSVPVEYAEAPDQIEAPFADEWENVGDGLPFESTADTTSDSPHSQFMSSPPNQIARQTDFSQDIEQPQQFYDAPSEDAEPPVDVFQALVSAGMITPSDHAPRIDRQTLPPEENDYLPDEDTFSEEAYSSDEQPVDLYQAMMNSGMIAPPAGRITSGQQGEIARKAEQASDSGSTTPDRTSVQYASETPRVMRAETADVSSSEPSSSTEQKSGDVDIDKLARDVYSALRTRLRIEKERRG